MILLFKLLKGLVHCRMLLHFPIESQVEACCSDTVCVRFKGGESNEVTQLVAGFICVYDPLCLKRMSE